MEVMEPPTEVQKPTMSKPNTHQEVFVSLSLLMFCCLWMPLCIDKYPTSQVNVGLGLLLFSFLSSITGCILFLVSIICNFKGYQKATPLCLVVAITIGILAQFVFDHQYCNTFLSECYGSCFIAECLSFIIYLLSTHYLMSMVLSRTQFQFGAMDLQTLTSWFGPRTRITLLLIINISELIIIFIHIHIYSYFRLDVVFNALDVVWVAFCTILVTMSLLLRVPKCVPIITHHWLLLVLTLVAVIAFGIGTMAAWRYRINDVDGMARIGNVFIWCVVNLWLFVEFITTDIDKMVYETLKPVAQTQQQ